METNENFAIINKLRCPVDKNQPEVNAVSKPSAQFTALCADPSIIAVSKILTKVVDGFYPNISNYERAIIELQGLFGLRISEALNIELKHILPNYTILVKGLKGSDDRIVQPVVMRKFWQLHYDNKISLAYPSNRFRFYRIYKNIGIYKHVGINKNNSVTHLLRYCFILSLLSKNIDYSVIQKTIGHKKIDSTLHYIKNLSNE